MNLKTRIKELESQKNRMIDYLILKVDYKDWHGVMDASCDIREIDVELRLLKDLAVRGHENLQ